MRKVEADLAAGDNIDVAAGLAVGAVGVCFLCITSVAVPFLFGVVLGTDGVMLQILSFTFAVFPFALSLGVVWKRGRIAAGGRLRGAGTGTGTGRVDHLELTAIGVRVLGIYYVLEGAWSVSRALVYWLSMQSAPPPLWDWIGEGGLVLALGLILALPGRALVLFVQKVSRV